MTIDEIMNAWTTDSTIDIDDLGSEAARSPNIHAKYLAELLAYKLKLTKLTNDILEYRAKRTKYYRGEMTREELQENGWSQWQYKTLKSEVDGLIDAEKPFHTLLTREQYVKAAIYALEQILMEIKSRSFHIQNSINWIKFRAGA